MKKTMALFLAILLLMVCVSASAYDYEKKALWTQEFGDSKQVVEEATYTNMRAIFEHCGNQDLGFDVDAMIDSSVGEALMELMYPFIQYPDPMGEDILNYWKNYEGGIIKEVHNSEAGWENEWASYVPASAYDEANRDKSYPMVFLNHGGHDKKYTVECFGFVQHAAKTQEYIVVAPQDFTPEAIGVMLNYMEAHYPVDMSRVYMTGDSAGGNASLNNAAAYPTVFAGIAPFGIGGFIRGTEEQKIIMGKYKMPIMYLYGDMDCYASFPVRETERASVEDYCSQINQWYAINKIEQEPLTVEKAAELAASAEAFVEKVTGIAFTNTYTKEYPDISYYFGENYDADGVPMYTIVIAEGGTHWQSASYAEITCDYFSNFSRDLETGQLVVAK